jgi:hypothetical protein
LIKNFLTSRFFSVTISFDVKILEVERSRMFDHETRMFLANEHAERLRATAQIPASPLRVRLGDLLVRAGRRLSDGVDCGERSAFAHEPLPRC